ncbi:MAG: SDR family oxidoreductase [Bdellovibrionales bacterium]|nr:SDR family oxidoreductase [Bdellovibrionales bacterium]
MKNDLILVVGATGTVGSELILLLKNKGFRTRATTSKPVQPTEDLVSMNMATGEGIKEAFEGVDRAFLLSPPGYADQYAMLSPLIQESKRRGLKKVVLMTAMGANASEAAPMRKAELELEKSGLHYNIIRPNWFFQNFQTFWIQGIMEENKILLPAGTAKVSFIDAKDISAVAAQLLTSTQWDHRDFDLTGPEAVDHQQVADAISRVAGRKIQYQEISSESFQKGLVQAGLPQDYAEFLTMIFGFLKEGYSARTTSSVEEITGKKPRSLIQYINENKNSWNN